MYTYFKDEAIDYQKDGEIEKIKRERTIQAFSPIFVYFALPSTFARHPSHPRPRHPLRYETEPLVLAGYLV